MVAGEGDDGVAVDSIPNQVFVGGVLGAVGVFLDRGTTDKVATSMTQPDGEVAGVAHETLSPVVIGEELAALADVGDGRALARLERRTDLAGELGRVSGVMDALDGDPALAV